MSKIRGPKGSEVTLKVQHADGQVEELTVKRDEIQVDERVAASRRRARSRTATATT